MILHKGFGKLNLGAVALPDGTAPKSPRSPNGASGAAFVHAEGYITEGSVVPFIARESGSVPSLRQPEKANATLSVRDLRREQIVCIGGLTSRQGRTMMRATFCRLSGAISGAKTSLNTR